MEFLFIITISLLAFSLWDEHFAHVTRTEWIAIGATMLTVITGIGKYVFGNEFFTVKLSLWIWSKVLRPVLGYFIGTPICWLFSPITNVVGTVNSMNEKLDSVVVSLAIVDARQKVRAEQDNQMLFELRPDQGCTEINEAFCKFFGRLKADMLGFTWHHVIHHSQLEQVKSKWAYAIETKTEFNSDQWLLHADGRWFWCRIHASPILNGDVLVLFSGTVEILHSGNPDA